MILALQPYVCLPVLILIILTGMGYEMPLCQKAFHVNSQVLLNDYHSMSAHSNSVEKLNIVASQPADIVKC